MSCGRFLEEMSFKLKNSNRSDQEVNDHKGLTDVHVIELILPRTSVKKNTDGKKKKSTHL